MGGTNESIVKPAVIAAKPAESPKANAAKSVSSVLTDAQLAEVSVWSQQLWPHSIAEVGDMLSSMSQELLKLRSAPRAVGLRLEQTQQIRQHVSSGEVHFHNDAEKLKASVPVGDWFGLRRTLLVGEPIMWLDRVNNTCLRITPMIVNNVCECVTSVDAVKVGTHFQQLLNLK